MTGGSSDRTAREIAVKHGAPDADEAMPVLDDFDPAVAHPMPKRPGANPEIARRLDDGQQFIGGHGVLLSTYASINTAITHLPIWGVGGWPSSPKPREEGGAAPSA
jgi:hypothetical protein